MKLILPLLFILFTNIAYSQTAKKLLNKGMKEAETGDFPKAIQLISLSIQKDSTDYLAWYSRGLMKSMSDKEEQALPDFDRALKLSPKFTKGYMYRAAAKKNLTDYEGALLDYSTVITLEPYHGNAYYNRGLIYELLNKEDSACIDFNRATQEGIQASLIKTEQCKDSTKTKTHSILRLTKTATDNSYGFNSEFPIKVGTGPNGGPANQKTYLKLLRDVNGNAITYNRVGSCCSYTSDNGFMGTATLDKYVITFSDENGKKKEATIFMTFYDYEEPKILFGFQTVGQK
ncbi:MAG: hypothetical protein NT150_05840 [Bacteroidetes bacterium]|nr:hypothetical protein [Bacteroidota bacterium]